MKTFEQACEMTVKKWPTKPTPEQIQADMNFTAEKIGKYECIYEEVLTSTESQIVAVGILTMCNQEFLKSGIAPSIEFLLKLALAHGVAIGMEMERQDDITQ